MSKLTPQTMANYRVRLRKLRELLAVMEDNHPERGRVVNQIEKLTNQLGLEMTELETQLARGPGRPRTLPDVGDELELLERLKLKHPTLAETEHDKEEQERKRQEKLNALRQRVLANPDLTDAERESARMLDEMREMGKEGERDGEQRSEATNELGGVGKASGC